MVQLIWPEDLQPFRISYYLQPHVGGSESPLTRTRKTYALSAPRWICRMSFRGGYDGYDGKEAFGPRLDAFIARLKGGVNRVAVWDFRRSYPLGLQRYYNSFSGQTFTFTGGETFANGERFAILSGSTPTNLATSSGATSMTFVSLQPLKRVFNAGDYIGGDGRTHIVLKDAETDASGVVVVEFEPPLTTAIAAGEAYVRAPTSMFQLTSNDAGDNEVEVGQAVNYTLDFVEDLV